MNPSTSLLKTGVPQYRGKPGRHNLGLAVSFMVSSAKYLTLAFMSFNFPLSNVWATITPRYSTSDLLWSSNT